MKFFKFLISKVFFLNLFIALFLLAGGYLYLNNYLESITKHGEKVVVPSVMNKPITELDELLLEKGFRYEVMDSIWERKLPKGVVLDQKPAPGDSVKEGRKVYVTINARSDKMIKLSIGQIVNGTSTTREALEYISSIDVDLDSIIVVPYDFPDIVLGFRTADGKKLKDGDEVKAGSRIRLVVGNVGEEEIRTPKVLGLTLTEAVKVMKKNLLNVSLMDVGDGACIEGLDSTMAKVVMQRPQCGDEIKVGKEVSLFYSCDSTYKFSRECK